MNTALLIFAIIFTGFFALIEVLKRHYSLQAENSRMVVHAGSSLIACFMPIWLDAVQVTILAILFVMLLFITRQYKVFSAVQGVKRKTWGEFTFAVSAAMAAWYALPGYPEAFVIGFGILGASDTAAQLTGRYLPLKVIKITGQGKSLGGALAFAGVSTVIYLCAYSYLGLPFDPWVLAAGLLGLTVIELLLVYGFDNLFIPLAAAMVWNWAQLSA